MGAASASDAGPSLGLATSEAIRTARFLRVEAGRIQTALMWRPIALAKGENMRIIFTICAPLMLSACEVDYSKKSQTHNRKEEPAAALAPEPGQRAHVLLADDNADMREYLCRLLAGAYDVTAVADGEDALVSARRSRPD